MRKLLSFFLCLAFLCMPCFASDAKRAEVQDYMNALTVAEEELLTQKLQAVSQEKKVHFCFVLVDQSYYEGKTFLQSAGIDEDDATVLVCVTRAMGVYYFDLYTFGAAEQRITDKEVERILDAGMPIKQGKIAEGLSGITDAVQTYYQSSFAYWGKCFLIAFCISLAIALGVYLWVFFAYRRKNRGVSYPLESYTNLELTVNEDRFMGTFVTKTRIPRPSSNSGGGGGGRIGGGGGGHRGGR